MTEVAPVDPLRPERSEPALAAAQRALDGGGLVVMPTETVYGIACRPDDPAATARLFEAKARPQGLNLAVLTASAEEALALAEPTPFADALATALSTSAVRMAVGRIAPTAEPSLWPRCVR